MVEAQSPPSTQASPQPASQGVGQPDPHSARTPIVVQIEVLEQLDSSKQKRGDTFSLQLAQAVTLPDGTVLPAGTPGRGEVVHADKAGIGGKPGELILAARTLETPRGTHRLRALQLIGTGKDRGIAAALGASIAGAAAGPGGALLGMVIRGGQVIVPAGTHGVAKLESLPQPPVEARTPSTATTTQPNQEPSP